MFASVNVLQGQSAADWLSLMDRQMVLSSTEYSAKMTIHLPSGVERVFRFSGKVIGKDFALIEFLEPLRQKGTRYLKRENSLWIYFPRQDRTMQIQGHMLRQGVQGGDLSFEDITESSSMRDNYTAEITDETDSAVTLRLTSHDMTVSYPHRTIILDRKTYLPVRMINNDASNHPIKEMTVIKSRRFGSRSFPVVSEIRSLLVEDKWTRFEIEDIRFGIEFPEDTFTKKSLEK